MLYPALQNRLLNQHEAIEEIIKDIPSDVLSGIPAPGKWSAKDHIAHLAKYQPVFEERMKILLNENEPEFERYLAENDPEFALWQKKDLKDLLSLMRSGRASINGIYDCLSERELNKTAVHKKYGRLTLVQWTEFFLLHEAHHIFSIFQLVRSSQTFF